MLSLIKQICYLDYMDNFKIAYESTEYNNGSMDYADFASSLMSFGKTLEIANEILNSSNVKLQINITSDFQNKCFLCKVTLKAEGLLNNLPLLSAGKDAIKEFDINDLLKIIGFIESRPLIVNTVSGVIVSFITYKLWEKGRKVENFVELDDGNVRVKIGGDEAHVTKWVARLVKEDIKKSGVLMQNLRNHFLPSGSKSYILNDQKKHTITEEDSGIISNQEEDKNLDQEFQTQEVVTDLKIRTPDLEGDKKWQFIYCGDTITPTYADDIMNKLKSITNQCLKNRYINVTLIIKYQKNTNNKRKQSNKYEIKSINGESFYKDNTKPNSY